ncbi:MAG TPA: tetratricopeptide repeat protein [Thermodesulfovibrionales bacterium]|nr:tetratricopeptide repeat protein [Thermodesulfovibrionales bacterium]
MARNLTKSGVVCLFVLLLALFPVAVCSGAADLCKQYAVENEYDKAIEECTKQINGEIKVKYLEYSYSNRGAAYANRKLYDEAIADYTKAIELNPVYATAYYNRGVAYANKKQFDEAVSDFNKVIELSPGDSTAYVGRATAYANKDQFDEAISDYSKAIELDPNDSTAYHNRALAYAGKKQPEEAVADLSKAVELSVSTPSPAAPEGQPAAEQSRKAMYHVQLGVFRNKNSAAQLTKRFKKKGYDAFMMKISAKDNKTLYRVLIGKFEDRQESEKLAAKIKMKEKMSATVFSE